MRVLAILAIAGFTWGGVQADGASTELSLEDLLNLDVQVSSTKPDNIFNTPSSVSIIDSDMIERYDFKSVSEALETLAGVSMDRTFFSRNVPTFRGVLQGHYVNKVLILIEGVPSWLSVTGDGQIDRIGVRDVARIEVLKGPASVLYGTNAYVGAINFVLKKAKPQTSAGQVRVGTGLLTDSVATSGHVASSHDGVSFYAGGEGFSEAKGSLYPGKNKKDDKGYFADENGKYVSLRDFQDRSNTTIKADFSTDAGTHTLLANRYHNTSSYLGSIPVFAKGVGNPTTTSGKLVSYKYSIPIAGNIETSANLVYDWNAREFSRKEDNRVKGWMAGSRVLGRLVARVPLVDFLDAEIGLDRESRRSERFEIFDPIDQKVYHDNGMTGLTVSETSGFMQLELRGDKLANLPFRLLTGARYTKNEAFNANTSLRSTLVYNLAERQSLKLVFGQSFRAPSLYELYFKDSQATNEVYGKKDLRPEKSDSLELAYLSALSDSLFLQTTIFRGVYKDKIIRVRQYPNSESDLSLVFDNGGQSSSRGVEVEMKYLNADVLDAHIAYSYEKTDKESNNLSFVPMSTATLGLSKTWNKFQVSSLGNYFGPKDGAKEKISAQGTVDLNLAFNADHGRHSVAVKNVTNKQLQYAEASRGEINSVYSGYGRDVLYEFSKKF